MKHQIKLKKNRGFSLVEMLIVISVIGVISAIAVPTIGSISGKANEGKAKRNAQNIASLFNSSRGVGASYTATDTSGIIDELVAGKTGPEVAGSEFKMSALGETEKSAAMKYVSYDSDADMMSYDPSGGQVADDGIGWEAYGYWDLQDESTARQALAMFTQNEPDSDFRLGQKALPEHGLPEVGWVMDRRLK